MTDKIKNLCLRTATGIAFVAVLVGGILWSNVTFTLLFAVVTGLSVREFCQVVNRRADVQTNAVICTPEFTSFWPFRAFAATLPLPGYSSRICYQWCTCWSVNFT